MPPALGGLIRLSLPALVAEGLTAPVAGLGRRAYNHGYADYRTLSMVSPLSERMKILRVVTTAWIPSPGSSHQT